MSHSRRFSAEQKSWDRTLQMRRWDHAHRVGSVKCKHRRSHMPLQGLRDLPVNRGMFGGMERWGGKKEELKLSPGGSSGKHWGLAGGAGRDRRSFHAECCSISCFLTLSPLPVLPLHVQMELHDLLKPISDHIQEIQNFRERNRGSRLFNHLSAISESIPALGWVAVVRKNATAPTKRH